MKEDHSCYLRPSFALSSEAIQYAFDPMYPRVSGMAARTWRRTSTMSTLPSFWYSTSPPGASTFVDG